MYVYKRRNPNENVLFKSRKYTTTRWYCRINIITSCQLHV